MAAIESRQDDLDHYSAGLMGSDQSLWGLLYESRATVALSDIDLDQMLRTARTRNASMRITGWLAFEEGDRGEAGTFTQYVEGPRSAVRRLFYGEGSRQYAEGPGIIDDSRHTDIRILQEGAFAYGPPFCRLYPAWFMKVLEKPHPFMALEVSE